MLKKLILLLIITNNSFCDDFLPSGLPTDNGGNVTFPTTFATFASESNAGGGDWIPPEDYEMPKGGGEDNLPDEIKHVGGTFGFELQPQVIVDADGYTYIINLDENAKIEPDQESISKKGFKVIKMRKGTLGLGITATTITPGFDFVSPQIGVNAVGSRGFVSEHYVNGLEEAKKIPFVEMTPFTQDRVARMNIGDSLTYVTEGTIGVHVGIALGAYFGSPVGITGVEANITGSWITNIRKVGIQRVQVAYTKGNIKNISFSAGSIGMKSAKEWYKNIAETFAFEFDLDKPNGFELYKRMLIGDIKTVKKYYLKEMVANQWVKFAKEKNINQLVKSAAVKWRSKSNSATLLSRRDQELVSAFFRRLTVKMITVGTRQSSGTAVRSSIAVPILFRYDWVHRDRSVVVEKTREVADGVIGTTHMGVYKELKATSGIATHHSNQIKLFMGGIQEMTVLNPGEAPFRMRRMFAQMKYEYHRTKWKQKKWDEKIVEAAAIFGFRRELLDINPPYDDKVDFGQQTADLLLSENSIKYLMGYANRKTPDELINKANLKIDQWFADESNSRFELCHGLVRPLCKKHIIRETANSVPKALRALSEVSKLLPKGDEIPKEYEKKLKEFSKAFAEFGQEFSKNQFILNAFIDLARSSPGDVYLVFQWQGSGFPRGSKVLIPSKYFKLSGHKVCGQIGAVLKERCDSPTNFDPM
jgi:hypothetical protein